MYRQFKYASGVPELSVLYMYEKRGKTDETNRKIP